MKNYLNILSAAFLAVFSVNAHSAVIDFNDNGTYTTDTISGLDWLDVTATVNQSYDYVSTQFGVGGTYEGWRYATGTEFNFLVSNYTNTPILPTYYGEVVHAETLIDGLIGLLGVTADLSGEYDYTRGLIADLNIRPTYRTLALLIDNDRTSDGADISKAHDHYSILSGRSESYVGSYLVRETVSPVPVPAALPLFGSALAVLGLFRRRQSLKKSQSIS